MLQALRSLCKHPLLSLGLDCPRLSFTSLPVPQVKATSSVTSSQAARWNQPYKVRSLSGFVKNVKLTRLRETQSLLWPSAAVHGSSLASMHFAPPNQPLVGRTSFASSFLPGIPIAGQQVATRRQEPARGSRQLAAYAATGELHSLLAVRQASAPSGGLVPVFSGVS